MKRQQKLISTTLLFAALMVFVFLFGCSNSSDGPRELQSAQTPGENLMFVAIAGDGEVAVIDEASSAIFDHIPVGAGPAIILATPDNRKAYTANWGDDTISVIDTQSRSVVATLSVPSRPFVIAMAPDGKHVYAGLYENQIIAINTETDMVEQTFATAIIPASLYVSPGADILYVATTGETPGTIWAISTETGETIQDPIEVGTAPGWITMKPDGTKVYALNFYSDDVSVVDTDLWTVAATIDTGADSKGVIGNVTPDSRILYVTNLGTGDLIAIDTETNEIFQTIPMGGRPAGVHFNSDASRVYVTDYGPESLQNPISSTFLYTGVWDGTAPGYADVVDPSTGEILSKIEVGPGPTSVVGIRRLE